MTEANIQDLLSSMAKSFQAGKAAGINATIQFLLNDKTSEEWVIVIKDEKFTYHQGKAETPDLTLTTNPQDFMDIFSGKIDPTRAYMQGKVKIKGNMGLAMKLMGLLN
jgi:putative sterol carrier protein